MLPLTYPDSHEGSFRLRPVSPRLELGAYEALWQQKGATWRRMADRFRDQPTALPSDLISQELAEEAATKVLGLLDDRGIQGIGVVVHQTIDYPTALRDARNPIELFYYLGNSTLLGTRCVSVVGTRNPSEEGKRRARRLAKELVQADFTVVSGLARGIDTQAHASAIRSGGQTIAVIGTPLGEHYPPENAKLQDYIARRHLLISQIPFLAYGQMSFYSRRGLFPERNATMSAISEATIIVEAGESSGTLTQARAALAQKRKLLILDSCFKNTAIDWPAKFLKKGAIRVSTFDDIREALGEDPTPPDH